ncbi:MAG: tetratricopeptide repeat protein [Proteobacteria bacterium]|nr:tetratricopeptide repeat protein [Pseudomonadota bacterium]
MLSAVLWAVNPLQTQAVTYIVQRMSSMAAMFYIIGIFLYIKARLSDSAYKKTILYFCIFLSYMLALGTKENTAILPLSLVLVEIIFFQDLGRSEIRRKYFYIAAALAVIITLTGLFLFIGTDTFNIFHGYENRYFTPGERLLTEARIIVYYISLIFYPAPTRLSIEHDIDVSTSFFYPWTTMPSIIIIVLLIGLGFWQVRKRPLLSFAILFFFLNHVIESSVIGLELIFEHRNYLPSFFLFVPVSVGLKYLMDRYLGRKSMFIVISSFVVLLVIGFGSGTYIRNIQWASEISLSLDAVKKAPQSARSANNFAKAYYEATEQYNIAIELYHKALYLKTHNRNYKAFILGNIAGVYYHLEDYRRAEKFWEKAVQMYPGYDFAKYRLALVSVKKNDWAGGLHYLNKIDSNNQDNKDVHNLKGVTLFNQGKHKEAFYSFKKCIVNNSDEIKSRINIGAAFCLMGEYGKAGLFLTEAQKRRPDDVMTLLWLIETGLRSKDNNAVKRYTERLCRSINLNELVLLSEKLSGGKFSEDGMLTPLLQQNMASVLSESVKVNLSGTKKRKLI